ncbi:MAG: WYL domain-containing protein [Planctomycetota bacterium]
MPLPRVQRLVRLLTLLQGSPAPDVHVLQEELGVSRRTLFRDLKLLKDSGIPVYHHEERGGYQVQQRFFLQPINLEHREVMGILLLARVAAAERGRPLTHDALSAVRKLMASLPAPIRETCADLIDTVEVAAERPPTDADAETRWYGSLQTAIDDSAVCRVEYAPAGDAELLDTQFHPYVLHFVNRAWYVLGYSHLHDEVRMLKLVRFVNVELIDETFDRPSYRAIDKLGNAWQLIPGGEEHDIELVFTPRVAMNVQEIRWHKSQRHERQDDGSLRVWFRVDGLDEIAWWLCGYADQVWIERPAALREAVRDMHRRAAGLDGSGPADRH